MTKKKNSQPGAPEVVLTPDESSAEAPTTNVNGVPLGSVVPMTVPGAPSRLTDMDRMALELARQQRLTTLAEARAAVAQTEKSELAYKYVVLQLYMKYGLTDADAISEAGDIIKGGALPQNQPKQQ